MLSVILDASLEVRQAIVFATFVVALVFAPVLALSGLQGSFFAPLAKTYILAILCSLVVALTVTPALTLAVFSRGTRDAESPKLQVLLKKGYSRVMRWVLAHAAPVIGVVALGCVLVLLRIPFLGGEFLPDFREGHFVLGVSTAPGSSLAETLRLGRYISQELLKNPNISTVEQQVGRAEQGEDTWGPERSEFHVELKPDLPGLVQSQVEDDIRDVLESVPGLQFEIMTFLGDRIGESLEGETAPVVLNLYGDDLDALDVQARKVADALATVPGAAEVQVSSPPGSPSLNIRLRPDRLTDLGLRPLEVLDAIQTAYQGEVVGQVFDAGRVEDIAVTLDPASRRDPANVGSLLLTGPNDELVPLKEVADVFYANGRTSILHDGARRRQTITANPTVSDLQSFVAQAKTTVDSQVQLPPGMYIEYSGAAQAQEAATRELLLNSSVAAVGILLLLSIVLKHWRNLVLVLLNLPLALAGGVLALIVSGLLGHESSSTLTMGALVGFVTLFGITIRNSIMLVSHYQHLVDEEDMTWNLETAIRGASERLIPILMTATVTSLGLLPLALGSGEAGREIEGPMAVVILGGLATSAVLNLIVLPPLALRWGNFRKSH